MGSSRSTEHLRFTSTLGLVVKQVHLEPAEHDRNEAVSTISSPHLPRSSASASNKVEYLAWLHHRKVALLSLVVQPIHDTFSRYRASAVLVRPRRRGTTDIGPYCQEDWLSAVLG